MGAWIETFLAICNQHLVIVAPRVGAWVGASYLDETGAMKKLKATNGLSELLQHEIDHINGIVAVDRAISTKHIILRSEM